ncbi:MAG TPA: DUF4232 domain-containing protein [Gaiellaceae bacterium]|nr:DUF4232 domain-containing protein [Gaiellaceae bacterium]
MKIAAALCLVVIAAGCGGTKTVTVTSTVTKTVTTPGVAPSPCKGDQLGAAFEAQAGSAAAGSITYVLRIKNSSPNTCVLSILGLQLLDANLNDVPTNATPLPTPARLAAGASVSYEARFSPDVTGTGDNQTGACEPVAHTLRATLTSGDKVDVPITPPTSVCEQGTMTLRAG